MSVATLRREDLKLHEKLGIDAALLAAAGVVRVTTREARERFGITYKLDTLDGIIYPYFNVTTGDRVTCRLRRDHPELDADGKPEHKYLAPFGDTRALYFPPGAAALVADPSVPIAISEAEKSALSLTAASARTDRRLLAIATGGCVGWKGTIGKTSDASGARVDVKGPLPDFDRIVWRDRDVVILFDANAATNRKVQAARRALASDLTGRGAKVRIAELPVESEINGPDDYIGKHGDAALFALIDGAGDATTHARGERRDRDRGPSQAAQLIDLALGGGVELWHTPSGDAYATVRVDGHREHHPLRRVVRDYLARSYYLHTHRSAASAALTDALATLGGMARYDGPTHAVSVRLASHNDATYLDLGDPDWRSIAIDANGWRVVSDAPVRCWRPSSLRPLPTPVSARSSVDSLRELWALEEDTWTLIVSWLVASLSRRGPYPILIETGEQGAGKSTLGRMLRGLVDPASPELRGVPRDERDVMIGALNSHVLALDNLSGLPAWLSDALCRIASGGGFATRTLYSDLDETSIEVTRPILLTGIEQPATRADLLDRALVVTLPAIDDRDRGDEADLWRRYHAMRAAVLAAICDAVSTALCREASVQLARRPRMADACRWVTAAEPALGWTDGRTVAAWLGARAAASADMLGMDSIGLALLALSPERLPWQGTAADLLALLTGRVPESVRKARTWPTSPRGLAGALRRLAPDLRRTGLAVDLPTSARTARERIITIRQGCAGPDTQDRQDGSAEWLSDSDDSACPECPVGPTGHPTGHQQDSDNTTKSGRLSDRSDLSCSTQPLSREREEGEEWRLP